ncbi:hypothetical protein [Acinetobacter gyllenbergii]|uniref:hypothetical protein n=1 Tax=Acinetobacter gyllenbergii TaxID=134534 RepID=UPI003F544B0E
MLDTKDKAKRNCNDVKIYRNKRKERIESGNPDLWNVKDCAEILATDYLRAQYGFMAWQKIGKLMNYPLPLNDKK